MRTQLFRLMGFGPATPLDTLPNLPASRHYPLERARTVFCLVEPRPGLVEVVQIAPSKRQRALRQG